MAKKIVTTTTTTVVTEEIIQDKTPYEGLLISAVLDMSGSMQIISDATISGYNEYINSQKNEPNTLVSLTLFDDKIETPYVSKSIVEVPTLNADVYTPRGMTALRDAIATAIDNIDALDVQPSKIIVFIMTDGGENASSKFTVQQLKDKIAEKEKLGWEFVYVGANQDAWQNSQDLGFTGNNRFNYTANNVGTKAVFSSMGMATTAYRSTGDSNSFSVVDTTNTVDNTSTSGSTS